ncbi:MAG TPA: DUF1223 domain-containing protein [Steroidobacteraceae bacterium]|jgi:hypothetical protein|nr:DUF1223 domain-containing protein [Steroidobacteraceae bacterium]
MKAMMILLATLSAVSGGIALATAAQQPASPVLIELFTAEGCSSCPPADAFLRILDKSQPVPGAQLIMLGEHVDYWDNQGWRDPFSSGALTERQRGYERALGRTEPYTPQFIVDGTSELRLSDRPKIAQALKDAGASPKIPVSIDSLKIEPGTPAFVSGKVTADGNAQGHKSDVFLALALDHFESKVLRGENRGQTLDHVAVVLELVKLGALTPGGKFSEDFRVPVKAGVDPGNLRVIGFVQESRYGKVIGAALRRTATGPG